MDCMQMAATLDMFPTIAKLAEAEMPQVTMDGLDMSPIILGNGKVINQ